MSYQKHFPVPPNTDEKHTNYVNGSTVLTADHMGTIRDAIQADEDYLVTIDGQIAGAVEDIADIKDFDQSITQEMNMMQDDIDNRVSVLPEQGLTDGQQRTARDNISASDANVTGLVIDPVEYWGADGSKSGGGISMTRTGGDLYTLSCPTTPTSTQYFKLSKSILVTGSSNTKNGWPYEIAMEEGVAYTLTVTPVGGAIYGTGRQVQAWVQDGSTSTPLAFTGLNGGSTTFVWPDATKNLKMILIVTGETTTGEAGYTFRLTLTKNHSVDNVIKIAGTTPTIVGLAGCRYVCSDTVTELTFTPPSSGVCSVRFTSGDGMVLNMPSTVKMPDNWTGQPKANATYEITVKDSVYGSVKAWDDNELEAAVLYNSAQSLTEAQQETARNNIGAANQEDIIDFSENWNLLKPLCNVHGTYNDDGRIITVDGCRFKKVRTGGYRYTVCVNLIGDTFHTWTFPTNTLTPDTVATGMTSADFVTIPFWMRSMQWSQLVFHLSPIWRTSATVATNGRIFLATKDGEGNTKTTDALEVANKTSDYILSLSWFDQDGFRDAVVANNNIAMGYYSQNSQATTDQEFYFSVEKAVVNSNVIAPAEARYATSAHPVGSLITYTGKLRKVTSAISPGDISSTKSTETTVADQLADLGEKIEESASDVILETKTVPIQYTIPSTGAYVNANTGATASLTGYSRTDFIDVSRYTHLVYARMKSTSSTAVGGMAFYSANSVDAYVSGQLCVRGASDFGYETERIEVPSGAKFARFTLKNDLTGFFISGVTANTTDSPLKGKHLSLLGDSMSAYEGYIPSGNRPYYNGTRGDVKRVEDMWWSKLCEITGMEPLVIDGWSGSSICYNFDNASDHPSEEDPNSAPMCSTTRTGRLASNGTNPDVIIVAGGTNDYSYGNPDNGRGGATTPIGTWNGKTAINTTDVDNGNSTFMETYATMIRRLQTNYPKAVIVCLSCWYTWRGTKAGDGSMRVNLNGDSAPDYSDAIRKVCGYLGIPCVDIYNVGFSDSNYYPYYASDSSTTPTHMNPAGHAVVARKIANELVRLAAPMAGA